MEILTWTIIFVVSLAVMVKSADWLLASAEKIGLAWGMSPFLVGVLIVGLGTSFPELISSFMAVINDASEIVVANAIGSNISNILLVVGLAAVIGKRLMVSKSLIDLDLPLLAVGTVLFLGVAWDGQVVFFESLLLLGTYAVYLLYTLLHKDDIEAEAEELAAEELPSRPKRRKLATAKKNGIARPKLVAMDFGWLVIGIVGLIAGSKYLIDSVVTLSQLLNIATGVIAISAVAVGTSLPELLVSVKAARNKKSDVALGNIFGSNVFNMLVVVGLPGLFGKLMLDGPTLAIGLPALALTTLLFIISGISRRLHIWEGAFYLSLYVLFIGKLFELF